MKWCASAASYTCTHSQKNSIWPIVQIGLLAFVVLPNKYGLSLEPIGTIPDTRHTMQWYEATNDKLTTDKVFSSFVFVLWILYCFSSSFTGVGSGIRATPISRHFHFFAIVVCARLARSLWFVFIFMHFKPLERILLRAWAIKTAFCRV